MFRTSQKYLWKPNGGSIDCFQSTIQSKRSFILTPCYYKPANINSKNYYELLGVEKAATQKEIKQAFVKLSKEYHPDSNSSDKSLHDKFVKINEAFTILSKQSTRDTYDQSLSPLNRYPRPYSSDMNNTRRNPYQRPYNEPNWNATYNDKTFYETFRRRMDQDRRNSYNYSNAGHFQGTYFAPASVIIVIIGFGMFIHALQWRMMQFSDPQFAIDPRTRHYRAYREWQRLSALKEAESMPMQRRPSTTSEE